MFGQRAMFKDKNYSAGSGLLVLKQIKGWFEPPVFPNDEDKTQHAKILYMLQNSMFVFLLLATMGII